MGRIPIRVDPPWRTILRGERLVIRTPICEEGTHAVVRRSRGGQSEVVGGSGLIDVDSRGWELGIQVVTAKPAGCSACVPSQPVKFRVVDEVDSEVRAWREVDGRAAHACISDNGGVQSLGCPALGADRGRLQELGRWFPTPVYEGRTSIVNECEAYYRDPLSYLMAIVEFLNSRGCRWVTWPEVNNGLCRGVEFGALIQLDLDGAVNSGRRVLKTLSDSGVRCNVMSHAAAQAWYEYDAIEEYGDVFNEIARNGWSIGYHNNALTEVTRGESHSESWRPLKERAEERFCRDVSRLRDHWDVRYYTNHGGNVSNGSIRPPAWLNVVHADRANRYLWRDIKGMFSDGAFLVRPYSLWSHVRALGPGLHFLRLHPFKYGNYREPYDEKPAWCGLGRARGGVGSFRNGTGGGWERGNCESQVRWIAERENTRFGEALTNRKSWRPVSRWIMEVRDSIEGRKSSGSACPVPPVLPCGCFDAAGDLVGFIVSIFRFQGWQIAGVDAARGLLRLGSTYGCEGEDSGGRGKLLVMWGLEECKRPDRAIQKVKASLDQNMKAVVRLGDEYSTNGAKWGRSACWSREQNPRLLRAGSARWSFSRESVSDLFGGFSDVLLESLADEWVCVTGGGVGNAGRLEGLRLS